jgi:hypothetical protein
VHELGVLEGVERHDRVLEIRPVEHLADKGLGELGLLLVDIDLHCQTTVLLDELVRFGQCVNERLVGARVLVTELRRREGRVERRRAPQHGEGAEHPLHLRILELLELERRAGQVRRNLRLAREQCRRGVRMRHGHGQVIEFGVLAGAELLLAGHLQRHSLDRDLHRWQGDAILVRKILEGLHVRIDRVEIERRRVEAADALHVGVALGAVPDGEERPDTARDNVHVARQERLVGGSPAGRLHPVHLAVRQAVLREMLLEKLLRLDDVERQIGDSGLRRDHEAANLGLRLREREGAGEERGAGSTGNPFQDAST